MSQSDFVSNVKIIPYAQQQVFDKLSDLNNLQALKDKMNEPGAEEKVKQMAEAEGQGKIAAQLGNIRERLDSMVFDRDTVSVNAAPLGNVSLRIVEREEPKTIKLQGQGTPVPVTLWIQLLPLDAASCKMRLTIRAELNMFIRGMVSKPLQEGVEKMASMLAALPYN